jgi:preprotein translocase subunit SecF
MNNVLDMVNDFVKGITGILVSVLGLGVLVGIVFGTDMLFGNVVAEITDLVTTLGDAGLVGLIVAAIVISLFDRK